MRNFLAFRTMLTPVLIEAIWLIGSALFVVGGLALAAGGLADRPGMPPWLADLPDAPIAGIALAVLGPLALRVYCEALIILFKIYERLGLILDATEDELEATDDLAEAVAS
jgi:Domain of unknown function (DUF4282)